MTTETIQAIPTRYKSIVYRSRAEARFAAFLHFSGCSFTYEPEFLRLPNEYVPDFVILFPLHVIPQEDRLFNVGFPINVTVIEYKPKLPNQEYLDSLHSNFREIAKRLIEFRISQFELCLATGSVYDDPVERETRSFNERDFFENNLTRGELANWSFLMRWDTLKEEAIEYAKTYRYDLED